MFDAEADLRNHLIGGDVERKTEGANFERVSDLVMKQE